MPILIETYTAPAAWASYLINGDSSGLEAEEVAQVDAWAEGLGASIVDVMRDESGEALESHFTRWHDAAAVVPLAADCLEYIAHREAPRALVEAQEAERREADATRALEAAERREEEAQEALESVWAAIGQARADEVGAVQRRNALEAGGATAGAILDAQAHLDSIRAREGVALDSLEAAQARVREAARERLAAREALEVRALAHRQAVAEVARLAALEEAQEALGLDVDKATRDLAEVAGQGRGWAVLAEYRGGRYFLGAHHFAADAESWAAAWRINYGPRPGLAVLVSDIGQARGWACNGDSVAFLDALEAEAGAAPGRPGQEVARWAIYAQARLAGRLVTVARAYASGPIDGPRWAEVERLAWPSVDRVRLVNVGRESVEEVRA